MKRNFDEIMDSLKTTIASYSYYVDFPKVYKNVDNYSQGLKLLNELLGKKEDFDKDFLYIIHKSNKALNAIPTLLAIRAKGDKVFVLDNGLKTFCFNKIVNSDEEYLRFMEKTGLKDLNANKKVNDLIDYAKGVEVGLDSNARKNRSGSAMESIVYDYLKSIPGVDILPQASKKEIISKYKYDELGKLNLTEGKSQAEKRFDFAFKYENIVYLIETNFYGSGGSKLNEVFRSYDKLADDINQLAIYRGV